MSTPQERIAEYLQKHYSGGEGWPPMHHAAEICKLFAPSPVERTGSKGKVRMSNSQEQITQYLMDYWPGMTFEQLRNHAGKICKLFDRTTQEQSLVAAIEGDFSKMSHGDLVLTCEMLTRGRSAWRKEAEGAKLKISNSIGCTLAGPGRGDCAHFIGLPGKSIPGQHDGPDNTVDSYGKPNGWCWSCWKDYKLGKLERENSELNKALALKLDAMPSGLSAGQSKALDDRLKTAASLLRSAVYERTPLGDKWIDHFDIERQKAITEFLASVEGKEL